MVKKYGLFGLFSDIFEFGLGDKKKLRRTKQNIQPLKKKQRNHWHNSNIFRNKPQIKQHIQQPKQKEQRYMNHNTDWN